MDKYYTPELKDLYAGYQCERLGKTENGLEYFPFLIRGTSINLNHIRTKYLTQEDIESLGFESKWNDHQSEVFQKESWILTKFHEYEKNLQINKGDAIYYRGRAKSINELKKILEWIL